MSKDFKDKKLLVITGPTATGKTDLALKLAKKFKGELISADSRQVYQGLDIGTGKLPGKHDQIQVQKNFKFWIVNGIKIWADELTSPQKQYSVSDYIQDAQKYVTDVSRQDKLPIIVGGTGFYIKALLEGLENLSVPTDPNLRKRLNKFSLAELQQELKKIYPQKWDKLNESDRQNPRRLVRAIELFYTSSDRDNNKKWSGLKNNFDVLKIGLTAPRKILYQNADQRVLTRLDQGMIEEAKNLHQNGLTFKRMTELGLEYAVLADYLQAKIKTLAGPAGFTRREAMLIKILQNKIHGFIRRQLTWFKKDKEIHWFDITEVDFESYLEKLVSSWYDPLVESHAKKN